MFYVGPFYVFGSGSLKNQKFVMFILSLEIREEEHDLYNWEHETYKKRTSHGRLNFSFNMLFHQFIKT